LTYHSDKQLRHRIKQVWKDSFSPNTVGVSNRNTPSELDAATPQNSSGDISTAIPVTPSVGGVKCSGQQLKSSNVTTPGYSAKDIKFSESNFQALSSVFANRKRRRQSVDVTVQGGRKRKSDRVKNGANQDATFAFGSNLVLKMTDRTSENSTNDSIGTPKMTEASQTVGFSFPPLANIGDHLLPEQSILIASSNSNASASVVDFIESENNTEDTVIKAKRLQDILNQIGVDWDECAAAQWLRKGLVFRPVSLPISPTVYYSNAQMERVKAFADLLFASSLFQEAFPLLLQVWIMRRGSRGYGGIKALIQCARSAVGNEDRALIKSLLKQEVLSISRKCPLYETVRSLLCLEVAHVLKQENDEEACNTFRRDAMRKCPSQLCLLNQISETQNMLQTVPGEKRYDILNQDIVEQAFTSMENYDRRSRRPKEAFEQYSLRDVLQVRMYTHDIGKTSARSITTHLRQCLKRAAIILNRDACANANSLWRDNLFCIWPGGSRVDELAIFFDLLSNWPAGSPVRDGIHFEKSTKFLGMSTLEIISTIAFLVANRNEIPTYLHDCFLALDRDVDLVPFRSFFGTQVLDIPNAPHTFSERVSTLLSLEDDKLLFGFLWCSVKLGRRRACDQIKSTSITNQFKEVVVDIFTASCRMEGTGPFGAKFSDSKIQQSFNAIIRTDPTLSASYSTTSTLASMRRQWKMTNTSIISSSWSSRARTIDELSDQASLMTLLDGVPSDTLSGHDIFSLVEGRPSVAEHHQVAHGQIPRITTFTSIAEGIPVI
jgi:hypothetical protein